MIISFKDLTKYYGANLILDRISGNIDAGSRIGIIGSNGAGKSTLIKILEGILNYDGGDLYINPSVRFGYLSQNSICDSDRTVTDEVKSVFAKEIQAIEDLASIDVTTPSGKSEYDSLLKYITSRNAYNIDIRISYVLNGMGFSDSIKYRRVCELSGGEKTRLAISKLLLTDSNVLLLDEPTNHLDFRTCAWLEKYLESFKGAVISVTHDRYYLDRVCNCIWELEYGKLTEYEGNYSCYKENKSQALDRTRKEHEEYITRREKLADYVARNLVRASTSAMAKSRQKELERMDEVEKPRQYNKQIHIKFRFDKKSWFDVFKCCDLSVSAGDKLLFCGLNLDIKAGERIAVIGDNGAGKTTLFSVLTGCSDSYTGKFKWGNEVSIGVFEQNRIYADATKTVKEEFSDNFPSLTENEVRTKLAGVLFCADNVDKKLCDISGGESARLRLAILSAQSNNTLLMDEPTNHLDMMSKEKLENALTDFCGTEIIISHDRYLLNTIPDKIVYLSKQGVIVFDGKFDKFSEYLESILTQDDLQQQKEKAVKNSAKEKRVQGAKARARISSCEQKIAILEAEIDSLNKQISEHSTDYEILHQACELLEIKKAELDRESEVWLELNE